MKRKHLDGLVGLLTTGITVGMLLFPQNAKASQYVGSMCKDNLTSGVVVNLEPNICAWKGEISGDLLQYDHHNLEDRALGYIPGAKFIGKKDHDKNGLFVPGAYVWGEIQDIQLGSQRIESFKLKKVKNFPDLVKVEIGDGLYTVTTNDFGGRVQMNVFQEKGSVIGLQFIGSKSGEMLTVDQIAKMAVFADNIWQLLGKEEMSRLNLTNYPDWYQKQLRSSYNFK